MRRQFARMASHANNPARFHSARCGAGSALRLDRSADPRRASSAGAALTTPTASSRPTVRPPAERIATFEHNGTVGFNRAFPWFQETAHDNRPVGEDITFCWRAGVVTAALGGAATGAIAVAIALRGRRD